MIVAIADDITGAAEIAGIGLRYGLQVIMSTKAEPAAGTELLVIATDTRSMSEEDAVEEIKKITTAVTSLKPEVIFKKIDSVLRGHVLAEVRAQLEILNVSTALVVAGNPSLGRTISEGKYFFQGKPIHRSSFSSDPEFAIKSSDILKMLRAADNQVHLIKPGNKIHGEGIIVGEVSTEEDLKEWSLEIDENILPVGAAGFFNAILETKGLTVSTPAEKTETDPVTSLYVCGTTFDKSVKAIRDIYNNGGPVSYMPDEILHDEMGDDENYQVWCNEIISFIHAKGNAIMAIDPVTTKKIDVNAKQLRSKTALAVKKIFDQENIHELFIEGGSTAAAIIDDLGLDTFIPVEEFAQGVVRMQVVGTDFFITVKPGSYDWPTDLWSF